MLLWQLSLLPPDILRRDYGAHRLSLVEAFKKKDKLLDLMEGPDTETLTPGTIPINAHVTPLLRSLSLFFAAIFWPSFVLFSKRLGDRPSFSHRHHHCAQSQLRGQRHVWNRASHDLLRRVALWLWQRR